MFQRFDVQTDVHASCSRAKQPSAPTAFKLPSTLPPPCRRVGSTPHNGTPFALARPPAHHPTGKQARSHTAGSGLHAGAATEQAEFEAPFSTLQSEPAPTLHAPSPLRLQP